MKAIKDYFKSERDYYSYILCYGSGETRTSVLRISEKLYSDRKAAKEWLDWITANTDGEEETNRQIAWMYQRMAGEDTSKKETKRAVVVNVEELSDCTVVTYSNGTVKRHCGRVPETARKWLWEHGGKQKAQKEFSRHMYELRKQDANPFTIESVELKNGKYCVKYQNGRTRNYSENTLPGTAKRFMAWEKEYDRNH